MGNRKHPADEAITKGVRQQAASWDIDFNADQVYDTMIRQISPPALQSAVFGQNNDVLDVCQFVIFVYFPLLGRGFVSFWLGSWVTGFVWVSGFALLGSGFGFPGLLCWVLGHLWIISWFCLVVSV